MDERRYSLSEVARVMGLTVQAFRKRPEVKVILQSEDYKKGARGAKLYRLSAFPKEIQ
ncbi:hypothetical protein IQ267_28555, partial [filamentous cyanobacterium LEGE 07170]|nr:hypothetical protein [filamentous cyanobacterium LEGE 07170]